MKAAKAKFTKTQQGGMVMKKNSITHPSASSKIAILGAGSWGTALALHLARLGQEVNLWTYDADHAKQMQEERINNRYLPRHAFPDSLHPISLLKDAIADVTDILVAVPSVGFRNTLLLLKPLLQPTHRIVWATKGMDMETGQLLHEVAKEILGNQYPLAVLAGPSFASEVAAGLPTAIVIASKNEAFAQELAQRFNSNVMRVYYSSDTTGVEIGGVLKNVLAIACGISDGMGFGVNARSALITRGLAEMIRLGTALGAEQDTLIGLTGVGDLVLTCTDNQSRNRRFGLALGKGKKPDEAEREIGQVVEGKRNAEIVLQLAARHHVEMPIAETVWAILQGKISPLDAMRLLFAREPKREA